MTKLQLLDKLISGNSLNTVIFSPILMHFAARYIGKTYGEFASDHKVLVEANLKILEDFNVDMVSLISDPYRETSAFGAVIEYIPEGVPVCKTRVINDPDDIKNLKKPEVYKNIRTLDRIKGAELYNKLLGSDVPVIGWIEGPLAEACTLSGVSEMLVMIMVNPDASDLLLDKCTSFAKEFALAQLNAGCKIIGMGDAICSQIDLNTYDRFVKQRHKDIISYIHKSGGLVKLHICGDISHLLPSIMEVGADIIDLDWQVDIESTHEIMKGNTILCGNINPVTIQNLSENEIYTISQQLAEKQIGKKFILSGGCEITVNTPHKNLLAMRNASYY